MPIFEYNQLALHYQVYGKSDRALLFIHGLGGNGDSWKYQIESFKSDYQVVTIDLFGHGKSTQEVDPVYVPRLDAEAAEALMRTRIKKPYVAIGHSFASNILPEIIKLADNNLKGVVFVDCTYQGFADIQESRVRFARMMLAYSDTTLKTETENWYNELIGDRADDNDRRMIMSSLKDCDFRWLFESVAGCQEFNEKYPPEKTPLRDNFPVFVMESEHGVGLNFRKSWVTHFKQAEYYLFENTHHFFFVTEQVKFNELLSEFLAQCL